MSSSIGIHGHEEEGSKVPRRADARPSMDVRRGDGGQGGPAAISFVVVGRRPPIGARRQAGGVSAGSAAVIATNLLPSTGTQML